MYNAIDGSFSLAGTGDVWNQAQDEVQSSRSHLPYRLYRNSRNTLESLINLERQQWSLEKEV